MVVTQRNIVHAAGSLVLSLFGVAGFYVLMEAGFLAAIQILVYIGAIAILIIFTIMLTRKVTAPGVIGLNSQWPGGVFAAIVGFAGMVYVINKVWPIATGLVEEMEPVTDSTIALGVALLSPDQYVLPFEVASVLLLGAMVGAIVIARTRKVPADVVEQHDESN